MYASIVVWMCNWWRSDDISRESFCWQWGQSSLPCHCDSFSSKDRKYVRPDYSIWQPSCEKEPHEGKKKNLIYSLLVMDKGIILVISYNPKITAKNWLKKKIKKGLIFQALGQFFGGPKNPHMDTWSITYLYIHDQFNSRVYTFVQITM